LNPVTALERRQVPRTRAALLLFLPALLLIILALNLLIPAVYREAVTFFGNLPDYTTRFNAWYHERISALHTESWPVDASVLIARLQAHVEKVLSGVGNQLL
jgi:predicted PurR-regulated permease PerM